MNQIAASLESTENLLPEIDLGSARGGKAGQGKEPLTVEVLRPLTEEDIALLQQPLPVAGSVPVIKSLRHSHHRLAELIAAGKSGVEISAVTGYSQTYISNIKRDPAFVELIAYYTAQKETIFVDAMARLRDVGIDALEKLHEQLHDDSVTWAKRELMELVEMAVVAPATAKQAATSGNSVTSNLSVEVKFVGAQPQVEKLEDQFANATLIEESK